ncbi:GtrA family protein [Sphingobium sufflavum]|uniref:GtrA family protein n=1 Tax=Sphingobium sufflavum TaxID=1129547 RepID=UPI001F3BB573|nr:GtrA family protein [Sphingobium sufflavum]MCE7797473.1 GtrA family protein [Sphingobium sufflavum]
MRFLSPVHRDLLRFTLLSGACWLVDMALLLALTYAGWHAAVANIASSLITAAMVYLLSSRHIHDGKAGVASPRLILYLVYTLLVILIASWLMAILVHWLEAAMPLRLPGAVLVVVAKVGVTPPQLVGNFFMSRMIARA